MFFEVWEQSERILRLFKASIPTFDLERIANQIAGEAKSISWMTCIIGRTELWAHGLVGDRMKEPEQHQMSETVLQAFLSTTFERIAKLDIEQILALPNLARLLFTLKESPWHQKSAVAIFRRVAGPQDD